MDGAKENILLQLSDIIPLEIVTGLSFFFSFFTCPPI
jgi:hypothetical protein